MNYKDSIEKAIENLNTELENLEADYDREREYETGSMNDEHPELDRINEEINDKKSQIERFSTALEEIEKINDEIEKLNKLIEEHRKSLETATEPLVISTYQTLIEGLEGKIADYRNQIEDLITDEIRETIENSNVEEITPNDLSDDDYKLIEDMIDEQIETLRKEEQDLSAEYDRERSYALGSMDNEHPELNRLNEELIAKLQELGAMAELKERVSSRTLTDSDYDMIDSMIDNKVEEITMDAERLNSEYDREREYELGSMNDEHPELDRINEEILENQKELVKYNELDQRYGDFRNATPEEEITNEVVPEVENNYTVTNDTPEVIEQIEEPKPLKVTPEQRENIEENAVVEDNTYTTSTNENTYTYTYNNPFQTYTTSPETQPEEEVIEEKEVYNDYVPERQIYESRGMTEEEYMIQQFEKNTGLTYDKEKYEIRKNNDSYDDEYDNPISTYSIIEKSKKKEDPIKDDDEEKKEEPIKDDDEDKKEEPIKDDDEDKKEDPIRKNPEPKREDEPKQHQSVEYMLKELIKDIELSSNKKKDNKKYTYGNIKVSESFANEMHAGNYLYNIAHFVPALIKSGAGLIAKLRSKITTTAENKAAYDELKERVSALSDEDILRIVHEYKGNKAISMNYPYILNTMIGERYAEYVMKEITRINNESIEIHNTIYTDMNRIKAIDKKLQENLTADQRQFLIDKRQELLGGKAELIGKLRANEVLGNNLLSGDGLHAFQEEMKAVQSKMNVVGLRFSTNKSASPELREQLGNLDNDIENAVLDNDDQKAIASFVSYEQISMENTEIKNSILGKRSVGERYYDPLLKPLDYRDDPFIKDVLTTIAVIGTGIATYKSIKVAEHNKEVVDAHNQDVNNANANNQAYDQQVHDTANQISSTKGTIHKGIHAEAHNSAHSAGEALERRGLDKSDWNLGSDTYHNADAYTHQVIGELGKNLPKDWKHIKSLGDAATTQDYIEFATKYNDTFIDAINKALPVAKSYAKNHPQFDYSGLINAMSYLQKHPTAIVDMESASLNNIELAEALQSLSTTDVTQISGIQNDLASMIMQNGAVGLMALNRFANDKNATQRGPKYGNEVTDMIEDSIDNDQVDEDYVNGLLNIPEQAPDNVHDLNEMFEENQNEEEMENGRTM